MQVDRSTCIAGRMVEESSPIGSEEPYNLQGQSVQHSHINDDLSYGLSYVLIANDHHHFTTVYLPVKEHIGRSAPTALLPRFHEFVASLQRLHDALCEVCPPPVIHDLGRCLLQYPIDCHCIVLAGLTLHSLGPLLRNSLSNQGIRPATRIFLP